MTFDSTLHDAADCLYMLLCGCIIHTCTRTSIHLISSHRFADSGWALCLRLFCLMYNMLVRVPKTKYKYLWYTLYSSRGSSFTRSVLVNTKYPCNCCTSADYCCTAKRVFYYSYEYFASYKAAVLHIFQLQVLYEVYIYSSKDISYIVYLVIHELISFARYPNTAVQRWVCSCGPSSLILVHILDTTAVLAVHKIHAYMTTAGT